MSETVVRGSPRFMGASGHFVLTWPPESDQKAEELITKKMREGFVFRVMGRAGVFGRQPTELQPLRTIGDVTERKVVIDDEDIARFVSAGLGSAAEEVDLGEQLSDQPDTPPMPRARNAREVMENDTIAHRPLRGG